MPFWSLCLIKRYNKYSIMQPLQRRGDNCNSIMLQYSNGKMHLMLQDSSVNMRLMLKYSSGKMRLELK